MNRLIAGFQEMSRSTEQGVDLLRQDASQLMKSIGFSDFPDFLSFLDPRNNQTRQQTQGGGQQQGQSIPSAQSGPFEFCQVSRRVITVLTLVVLQ